VDVIAAAVDIAVTPSACVIGGAASACCQRLQRRGLPTAQAHEWQIANEGVQTDGAMPLKRNLGSGAASTGDGGRHAGSAGNIGAS
jgi:hypothetical protein